MCLTPGSGENIQALQIGRFLSRHVEMEEFLCIVFMRGHEHWFRSKKSVSVKM